MDYSTLKYFIIDVDGTLTDSGIYYSEDATRLKKFSTRDMAGVIAAHFCGFELIAITGRESLANITRLNEMKIDSIYQNVKNKKTFVNYMINERGISKETIGYIGDDLNDYGAMRMVRFIACPADANKDIIQMADYVSPLKGGEGVLQDVFRFVLVELKKWDAFLDYIESEGY